MNWSLFTSTFVLIFLAELGDKTQLAVMSQSAASSSKWTVFMAGALALAASTAMGVLAGDLIRRFIPDARYIKCAGGVLFLLFGALMLRDVFAPRSSGVERENVGMLNVSGWVGRFVIQQVAVLEKQAFEDYEALAAQSLDPSEKAVFQRLATEERWHYEAMCAALATGTGQDIPITASMAEAFPSVDDLMHDAVKSPHAIEHAIEHEHAMASFYRTLAHKCSIPRLRETFLALAVAEENHARRLQKLIVPQ